MTTRADCRSPLAVGLIAFVLTALVFLLAAEASAQLATGRGRLQGRVTDVDGNPIAGARVVLTFVATGDEWEVITDGDGRWLKGSMGRGMWNIDVHADGFQPQAMSADVSEVQRMMPVQVVMERGDMGAAAGDGGTFSAELTEALKTPSALYAAGDFAGALAAFDNVIATMPNEKNLHLVRVSAGNAAYELESYDAAMRHFEAALAAEPDNTDARIGVAKVHMMQRNLEAAVEQIEKLDLASVRDPIVFYNIGTLFFEQGQSVEAARYYALALERDPSFADAHMQIGLCYLQQGKMEEARPHFEKVVELAPGTENAAVAQEFLDMIG